MKGALIETCLFVGVGIEARNFKLKAIMNKPGGAVDSIGSYFEEEKEPIIFDDQGLDIALKHAGVTEEQTDDYLVIGNYYFEYEAGTYNVILTINEMNHSYLMDSLRKYLKIEVFPADWIL